MTSLIEDCQAWINKGQESWKSYFSKWETFAEYEESLPENELIQELSDKSKERRNGSQKLLKLQLAQKRLKRVFFRNQKRKQKKVIEKKKSCLKGEEETWIYGNEKLEEILENKHLEITLTTVFSDLLKANTNKYGLFAVLFQTFTGREVAIKDSDHLLARHQQVLPFRDFERRVANLAFQNQRALSVSMPTNNLAFENQRVLTISKLRNSLNARSICPPRDVYFQNLNENPEEINSEQIESNLMQSQNAAFGTKNAPGSQRANNVSRNNFSKQQSTTLIGCQTPILENRSNSPYKADLCRIKNTKFVGFDSNHKFSRSFCQATECIRSATIYELSKGRRHGNLILQHKTNRITLSMDNANFVTAQKKLSEQNHLSKTLQKRLSSKKLFFDYKESDSDSDNQTKYHSPFIHHQNKRLKADHQVVDASEPDADDCLHIFDRVMKS